MAKVASVGILLVALAIRLLHLSRFSFWLDEVLEAFWIGGSWKSLWSSLRFDAVHPPLDYWIAKMVTSEAPEWVHRLPDVAYGVASIAACHALLVRRADRRVAGIACGFLAIAPFHVRYSQEFRPHILGLCLVLVSLLALERFLQSPDIGRLVCLFLATLATWYTLYLGAVALAVAGIALLVEDAIRGLPARRRIARRSLQFSPLFFAALVFGYLPWLGVVREAARRSPFVGAEPLTLARLGRELSFFTTDASEGSSLRAPGALIGLLALGGAVIGLRRRGVGFVAVWLVGFWCVVEVLGRIHPHFYAARRILAGAPAIPILAAICLVALLESRLPLRIAGVAAALVAAAGMVHGLTIYFDHGRPDWRPMADFLRRTPKIEMIFSENQWTQLCLAYYLDGPRWLSDRYEHPDALVERQVFDLAGDVRGLAGSWVSGVPAWVALGGNPDSEQIRAWSAQFEGREFPKSEGRARLVFLDPRRREQGMASIPP
jgi:hypothetical protein